MQRPKNSDNIRPKRHTGRMTRIRPYDAAQAAAYRRIRRAEPALVKRLAEILAVRRDGHYLDVGCGSGHYACALADHGGTWAGLDPSPDMLAAARQQNPHLDWHQAAAENLPFDDSAFDGLVSILALHHMPDMAAALTEMRRVVKPGGCVVLFTATCEQTEAYWLSLYLPQLMAADAQRLPRRAALMAAAAAAGFAVRSCVDWQVGATPQERWFFSGRHQPQFYLDADFRAATSVFDRADPHELAAGLAALRADLDSGVWAARVAAHEAAAKAAKSDYVLLALAPV